MLCDRASKLDFNQHYKSTVAHKPYMSQHMRLWNLVHYRATKAQPSLCISTNTKCYDIDSDTRDYDDTCTNRDPLSPHAVFVFLYFPLK